MGQGLTGRTAPVVIRPVRAGDEAAIHALTDAAFGNVDDESAIIDRLRDSDRWISELSIVAEDEAGLDRGPAGHEALPVSLRHRLMSMVGWTMVRKHGLPETGRCRWA